MFEAWGRGLYRARRLTLVIAVVFALAAGAWGTSVFGRNDADVVVLYHSPALTVSDPAYRQAVTAALAGLPAADVKRVTTYWSSGQPTMISADRHSTYAVLLLAGADDQTRQDTYKAIKDDFSAGAGASALSRAGITARV